jgi:predicted Zn finger-like uncharacterized protein
MIIECPSCNARAKLPESKDGAKVRCPECERVYVARPVGSKGPRKEDPTKYFIIGGVVVVGLLVLVVAMNQGDSSSAAPKVEPEPQAKERVVDDNGYDSPTVKAARNLHAFAASGDKTQLNLALDAGRAYAARNAPEGAEDAEDAEAPAPAEAWAVLDQAAQAAFAEEFLEELVDTSDAGLVANWIPYHGEVVASSDQDAIVRLTVQHRDPALGLPDRHVEWGLLKRGTSFKAWYWRRWYAEGELSPQRTGRTMKTERKVLSDGSEVIESQVRPIPYDADVPQELRGRIDGLIAQMIDPEATKIFPIQQELTAIGKPAIAPLLTKLSEIPLDTVEQAIQLNLVHLVLSDITGYVTTFDVHELMGATRERQESGLRQWFGWYDRKYKRFEGRVEEQDPLYDADFQPRNEAERIEYEKWKREQSGK